VPRGPPPTLRQHQKLCLRRRPMGSQDVAESVGNFYI